MADLDPQEFNDKIEKAGELLSVLCEDSGWEVDDIEVHILNEEEILLEANVRFRISTGVCDDSTELNDQIIEKVLSLSEDFGEGTENLSEEID